MSIYDKKLYIKKTDGNIQTANLYTDKTDVGDNYLTFKYNGNTVYAVLNTNGDIDFNVSYNHNLYKIKNTFEIVWKTDEYRISELYPSTFRTMTELPNDRDWIEFVKYRKNLNYMFDYCQSLTKIPQIDTSSVTSMYYMFSSCTSLTTVPLFDTSNVTGMNSMFQYCYNLTTVPQFNTLYEMIGGVPSSGVFLSSNTYAPRTFRHGGDGYHTDVTFDASRSNKIYGTSNTVQPASIIMLPCIRY